MEISLSPSGVQKAIDEIKKFKQDLQKKIDLLAERLATEGVKIAAVNFKNAQYDGINDVSVTFEKREEGHCAVVATGSAVLFIEFGSGVHYGTPTHPEAAENEMNRGEYGKGYGKQDVWWYYGEPGTNGLVRRTTEKGDLVSTRGNPANMSMYITVKELEDKFSTIAKEVFSK